MTGSGHRDSYRQSIRAFIVISSLVLAVLVPALMIAALRSPEGSRLTVVASSAQTTEQAGRSILPPPSGPPPPTAAPTPSLPAQPQPLAALGDGAVLHAAFPPPSGPSPFTTAPTTTQATTTTTAETTTVPPTTTAAPTTTAPPPTTVPTTTSASASVATTTTSAPSSATTTSVPSATTTTALVPVGPTAQQWEALRQCESGGRYDALSPDGRFRGAYQFLASTWDWVAGWNNPELVGTDPAAAAPADQDSQAFALYDRQGAAPWPTCGRHLL